jgi:hypothetical protein
MAAPLSTSPQYAVTKTLRRNDTQINKLVFSDFIKRKFQKQNLNSPQNSTAMLTHCSMGDGYHRYGQENGVQFIHSHIPCIQNIVEETAGYGKSHKAKNCRKRAVQSY